MTEANEARLYICMFFGIWFGVGFIIGIIVGKCIHFLRGED